MACERYALYCNEAGRKVTQPLHHDGEPPKYYDCKDGTRLPLVMVQRYPIPPMRAVGPLSSEVMAIAEGVARRTRERNARLYGGAAA